MHEYSLVASLIGCVEREAARHGAERVHRLHVAIGELAGVELDLLQTAFETLRDASICRGAELALRPVAACWTCPRCDRALVAGAVLRCSSCGAPAHLTSGDEIVLERIEMEVADV